MATYETRHLVALVPLRHEGFEYRAGDEFAASDVDARYYVTRGRARHAEPIAPAVVAEAAPTPQRRVTRRNTKVVETTAPVEQAVEQASPVVTSTEEQNVQTASDSFITGLNVAAAEDFDTEAS